MKNKGVLLLLLALLLLGLKYIKDNNNRRYHNEIIDKIKDNYRNITYEYIEIPKYNIRRLIKEGTSNSILDNYYVGKMYIKDNLILLAGHNINLVFHKIHYLKKDDIVYYNGDKYTVLSYKEISIYDYSIIKNNYKCDTIILMTCTKNKNKRYIVICEKK